MTLRILLIDDDSALLRTLEDVMRYGGFRSRSVRTGLGAIEMLRSEPFDAVLMDLGLPDIEGGDLLRSLREVSSAPILVVSGRAEQDKIEALDQGADDYLSKPFSPDELLARIRAAVRRQGEGDVEASDPAADIRITRLGGLSLDPRDNSASLGDRSISLTDQEYKILKSLALSRIAPVSRAALMEMLYGAEDTRQTKIIEVYIGRIRNKLDIIAGTKDLIETRRGHGWFLHAPK